MHKREEKQRKWTFFEENSKKICVFEKKVVPLHDFSRGVGSLEPWDVAYTAGFQQYSVYAEK